MKNNYMLIRLVGLTSHYVTQKGKIVHGKKGENGTISRMSDQANQAKSNSWTWLPSVVIHTCLFFTRTQRLPVDMLYMFYKHEIYVEVSAFHKIETC